MRGEFEDSVLSREQKCCWVEGNQGAFRSSFVQVFSSEDTGAGFDSQEFHRQDQPKWRIENRAMTTTKGVCVEVMCEGEEKSPLGIYTALPSNF